MNKDYNFKETVWFKVIFQGSISILKYVHIKENITEVKVASSTRFQVTHNLSNLGNLIGVYLMSWLHF